MNKQREEWLDFSKDWSQEGVRHETPSLLCFFTPRGHRATLSASPSLCTPQDVPAS